MFNSRLWVLFSPIGTREEPWLDESTSEPTLDDLTNEPMHRNYRAMIFLGCKNIKPINVFSFHAFRTILVEVPFTVALVCLMLEIWFTPKQQGKRFGLCRSLPPARSNLRQSTGMRVSKGSVSFAKAGIYFFRNCSKLQLITNPKRSDWLDRQLSIGWPNWLGTQIDWFVKNTV